MADLAAQRTAAANKAFGPGAFKRFPGGHEGGFYKYYQREAHPRIEHNTPSGSEVRTNTGVYHGGARARPLPSPRSHPYPNSLKGPERV